MRPEEFADKTGIGKIKIVDIIKNRRGIDKTVSDGLASYFGNSSKFWLDPQQHFDHREGGGSEIPNTAAIRLQLENTHKRQLPAKALNAEGHFGRRFREDIFVFVLITFLAYMLLQ